VHVLEGIQQIGVDGKDTRRYILEGGFLAIGSDQDRFQDIVLGRDGTGGRNQQAAGDKTNGKLHGMVPETGVHVMLSPGMNVVWTLPGLAVSPGNQSLLYSAQIML
jgi:hypothetical protein